MGARHGCSAIPLAIAALVETTTPQTDAAAAALDRTQLGVDHANPADRASVPATVW